MDVSVIVVNYNTGELIRACLDSVLKQVDVKKEIIVVDNASQDISLQVLETYRDRVRVIINIENKGFACANNQAAHLAQGQYLFLLNPDASFQDLHALKNMFDMMQSHPEIGLSGTQVIKGKTGGYSAPQFFYPGQRHTSLDYSFLPGKIAWVIGASMMMRRDVFEKLKGFDEDYFLYGEEADLCLRIRKMGFQIGYNPLVVVDHLGGGSEFQTRPSELWRKKQKGLHLFIQKNYPLEEATKIIEMHIHRAKRKLFFLKIKKLLGLFRQREENNYERYQTILSTSEKFIETLMRGRLCV